MAELFIAADDFTGALDTGVKLAAQGISVRVVSGFEEMENGDETVLVSNLDSRHLDRDTAFKLTYSACVRALKLGIGTVYIKTDSGLRGNIGAALEAAARAVNGKVVFAPAYPALNRRTENGVHMIGNVPVTQSVFGRDLLNPVTRDRTRDIIAVQSELPILEEMDGEGCPGPHIELLELNSDEEMLFYAMTHAQSAVRAYAGCAGFAAVLRTLLELRIAMKPMARIRLPVVVLSASLSEINFEQMRAGERAGLKSCVFSDILEAFPDMKALAESALRSKPGALIESAKTYGEAKALSLRGERLGLNALARSARISFNMGLAARKLIKAGFNGMLCLFGGDTVAAALRQMDCGGLIPVCELEPGVAVSIARLHGKELPIVTKSGSFGSPDVIERIIKAAEEERE